MCSHKILPENIIGLGSDSARNMIERHNSLCSRLKGVQPALYLSRCVCHIAATCGSNATEALPAHLERLIIELYAYFNSSSVRQEEL